MKRIIAVFLSMFFVLTCGCSGLDSVIQTPVPTDEPQATAEAIEKVPDASSETASQDKSQIIVNIKSYEYECKDPESGIYTILSYYVEDPVVYIDGKDNVAECINACLKGINSEFIPSSDAVGVTMDYFTYLQSVAEDNYMLKKEAGADLTLATSFTRMVKADFVSEDAVAISFVNIDDSKTGINDSYSEELHYFRLDTGEEIEKENVSAPSVPSSDCSGTVSIICIDDSSSEFDRPVIDYISVNDDGESFLINVNGTIENIKISKVGLIEGKFVDYSDYWFCNYLTDSVIQIKAAVNRDKPDLKISYETAAGLSNMIISRDESDNLIFMLEDEWTAVG